MAEPSQLTDSDATESCNTLFIDTSLDTRFITIVSNSDTVADLKKKILHEHEQCFPDIGSINIKALKVKRRGCFYHLSESMLVKSAFHGRNKNWFITVDACRTELCDGVVNGPVNMLPNGQLERLANGADLLLEAAEIDQGKEQKVTVGLDDVGREDSVPPEGVADSVGGAKKKRKKSKKRKSDVLAFDESDALVHEYAENKTPQEPLVPESSLGNGGLVVSHDMQTGGEVVTAGLRIKSLSDASKQLDNVVQRTNVLSGEAGDYISQFDESPQQEASHAQPATEESPKIEKEKGHKDLQQEKITLFPDSNKGTSRVVTVSEEHENADATSDGLAETINDVDLHSAPRRRKKIHKRKSSNPPNQDIAAVPSPATSARGENSLVSLGISSNDLGGKPATAPVQEVNKSLCSEDVDINDKTAVNVENQQDVPEPASAPDAKMISSRNKEDETDVAATSEFLEVDENIQPDESSKKRRKSKKTRKTRGENPGVLVGITSNNVVGKPAAAPIQEVNERLSSQDIDANVEGREDASEPATATDHKEMRSSRNAKDGTDVFPTSDFLEVGERVVPDKSSKKRKKSKKARALVGMGPIISNSNHLEGSDPATSPTEPHKAANGNDSGHQDNVGRSSMKKGEGVSEMVTASDFYLATDREINDVINNVVESVQQMRTTHSDAENVDGISRKRRKEKQRNRQHSDGKRLLQLQAETGNISKNCPAPLTSNTMEVDPSSKVIQKTSMETFSCEDKLNEANLGHEKDTGIEDDPPTTQLNSVTLESSHILAQKFDGSSEGRCLGAVANSCPSKSGHMNKPTNNKEVSSESTGINFVDYFVPSKQYGEAGSSTEPIDKATHAKSVVEMKSKLKKRLKLDVHSRDSSPDFQAPLNAKSDKTTLHMNMKPSEVSGGDVQDPVSGASSGRNFNAVEASKSKMAKPPVTTPNEKSKKESQALRKSSQGNSKSTDFRNTVASGNQEHNRVNSRKPSSTNPGVVLNRVERGKSLIGKSGTIFNDDNFWDSMDDNELDSDGLDSEASTRTPSDKSLSSDYSDGESNSIMKSTQNGSDVWKRKGTDKKFSSGISLDTILRSSSRFKKAKLAAESQLEDTESQPVDFVPDSQAFS